MQHTWKRSAYKILEGNPEGKGQLVTPSTRMNLLIKTDLEERGKGRRGLESRRCRPAYVT